MSRENRPSTDLDFWGAKRGIFPGGLRLRTGPGAGANHGCRLSAFFQNCQALFL